MGEGRLLIKQRAHKTGREGPEVLSHLQRFLWGALGLSSFTDLTFFP